MISSRLITDLSPKARDYFYLFRDNMQLEAGLVFGVDWGVSRTKCDIEYQIWLYASGRTRPGPKVTNTLKSDHILGNAWDIYIKKGNVALWSVEKADVDQDGESDYIEAANVGKRLGLDVGGFWKSWHDWPHYGIPKV